MWNKGDRVVISGDVETLKSSIIATPDLIWRNEYQKVVDKQGIIVNVHEGYAEVEISTDVTLSIPFKSIKAAEPSSPTIQAGNFSPSSAIEAGSSISVTSEKRLRRSLAQHQMTWLENFSNICDKKGSVVKVQENTVVVQVSGETCKIPVDCVYALKGQEIHSNMHIDPIPYDNSILDPKRKSMSDESLALAVSMRVLVCSEAELKKLVSEKTDIVWDSTLHPRACGKPGIIKSIKQYLITIHIAHSPHTVIIPAKGLTVIPPLSVGIQVSICPSKSDLKKLVEMHPEDLMWDEGVYSPILGKKGTIVEIDDDLIDVDTQGNSVTIPVGGLSERSDAVEDMSPKHISSEVILSPPKEQSKSEVIEKGAVVVISVSTSELRKLISKEDEDDIMWDDDSHTGISGKTVTIIDIDDRILDVKLPNSDVVSIPRTAVSFESQIPKAVVAAKPQAATPQKLKAGITIQVCDSGSQLKREIKKYPEDLEWDDDVHGNICGKKGTVVSIEDGIVDLTLASGDEVSVPESCVSTTITSSVAKPKAVQPIPVQVPAKKASISYKKGMVVQICSSKSDLQRIIKKYPDDLEWDEPTHGAAVGATGTVIDIDESILDVRTNSCTVSVPSDAVSLVSDASKAKPAVVAPQAASPVGPAGRFFLDNPTDLTHHFVRCKLKLPSSPTQLAGKPVRLIKQINPIAAEVEWEGGVATVPMAVLQVKGLQLEGRAKQSAPPGKSNIPPPLGAKANTPGPYSNQKPGSTLKKVGETKGCCLIQ